MGVGRILDEAFTYATIGGSELSNGYYCISPTPPTVSWDLAAVLYVIAMRSKPTKILSLRQYTQAVGMNFSEDGNVNVQSSTRFSGA